MKKDILLATFVLLGTTFGAWQIFHDHFRRFMFKGQSEKVVEDIIYGTSPYIISAATKLDINPRVLASVIYAENRVNVNFLDAFEKAYAYVGHNASIGVAQVKINTAKWIMDSVTDTLSAYYLDSRYHQYIPSYNTRQDIVELLKNDSTNCLIAAFYIKQIIQRWQKAGLDISDRPDIVTTLYSYGVFRRIDNSEIVPHEQPQSNPLGDIALKFYRSKKFDTLFP